MSYGFDNLFVSSGELDVQTILKKVSDIMLWRHYLDEDFILGKVFSSPLRADRNPSFSVFIGRAGNIIFNDFATKDSGNIFHFIGKKYNLGFYDVLLKINGDFSLNLGNEAQAKTLICAKKASKSDIKKLSSFETQFKRDNRLFQIVPRSWTDIDLEYWSKYGINKHLLDTYNVYPVKKLIIENIVMYQDEQDNPGYCYFFPMSKHMKIYFPKNKNKLKRFVGNVNNFQDIQGYYQCIRLKDTYEGKMLVLTKSMKDCMTLRRFGIDAMSIHGETHKFYEDFIRHIKKYYPRIISLYDRDKAGVIGAKELWKKYEIIPYFIPKKYKCKDVSDMFMVHDEEEVRNFIEGLK